NGNEAAPSGDFGAGVTVPLSLDAHADATIEVAYRSRGLGAWTYSFAGSGVSQIHDFALDMKTDFRNIDFPAGTISPSTRALDGRGYHLAWNFESLVTGQKIGMDPPNRLNP